MRRPEAVKSCMTSNLAQVLAEPSSESPRVRLLSGKIEQVLLNRMQSFAKLRAAHGEVGETLEVSETE